VGASFEPAGLLCPAGAEGFEACFRNAAFDAVVGSSCLAQRICAGWASTEKTDWQSTRLEARLNPSYSALFFRVLQVIFSSVAGTSGGPGE
jgi:hypothetical protein